MKAGFIFSLIAFVFLVADANAQWHVGGLLDVNRSTASVDPAPDDRDYSSRTAFGIGAVVDYDINDQFGVHTGLMLQGKGNVIEDEDFDEEVTWKTSYVEVPVLLRYTMRGEQLRPFLAAGPSLGFLRSAKFEADSFEEDDEEAKSLDLGLAVAGGVKMPYGRTTLFGELRYVHGLINVVDTGDDDFSVMNRGLQLLVGVTFPIGR